MYNLGLLLAASEPEAARRWHERAAEAGNTSAIVGLGVQLAESDPEAGRRWRELADAATDPRND
jgi:hypothetical protein